jgi:hypothetical protein
MRRFSVDFPVFELLFLQVVKLEFKLLFLMCVPLFQGMAEVWEQVKEMRDREEEANQRAGFLEQGFGAAWMEGAHTDIVVKPGNGPPIPAHKAILVSRHFHLINVPSPDFLAW